MFGSRASFSKKNLSLTEFLDASFEIGTASLGSEESRVHNLVARIRRVLPKRIELQIRLGRIVTSGKWSQVLFLRDDLGLEAFSKQAGWRAPELRREKAQQAPLGLSKGPKVIQRFMAGQILTRSEIEKITGKSRASVVRLLNRWMKNGWILRKGQAKGVTYTWKGAQ